MLKNLFLWLVIAVVLITVFSTFSPRHTTSTQFSYSEFIKTVGSGNVASVVIQDSDGGYNIQGKTKDNRTFSTFLPMTDQHLLGELINQNIDVKGMPPKQQSLFMHF
jgi:cell division protease FtsH